MKRVLQACAIVATALASWAIGVATGVALMAPEPPPPPKWERSL